MAGDVAIWADAWESAYRRGLMRWRSAVRWAFVGAAKPRRKRAALRLVKLAARAEAAAVEVRYHLGMPVPPSGRGMGPA